MADFNLNADRLHLERLEIDARIGVTEEERNTPQRIVVCLTFWPNTAFDQLQDDIGRAINYVDLCRVAREFVQSRESKLIETLAADMGSELLRRFSLEAIEVEIRKFVLPNTEYVSAIARRSATKRG